ncbi:hypothetical protein E2C01_078996 [Portunus trituberculatus]|uniref:Uncharacterized protein n=1 Tax=Portunus trituberculatus TaxID=210409 RepID=A0A5B7IVM6_PORTR|nr:hypothetical protein [Portunus trituberculatus]
MTIPRLTPTTERSLCLTDSGRGLSDWMGHKYSSLPQKALFQKRRWRVSTCEGEEPQVTCERGGDEAGEEAHCDKTRGWSTSRLRSRGNQSA